MCFCTRGAMTTYQPARGLKKLTWAQVEAIDKIIAELCRLTGDNNGDAEMTVEIKRGALRRIRQPVMTVDVKPMK